MKKQVNVLKIFTDKHETVLKAKQAKDLVAQEYHLDLFINSHQNQHKQQVFQFICSPAQLKELVVGFLLSEGFIRNKQEILELRFKEEQCFVELVSKKKYPLSNRFIPRLKLHLSFLWFLMNELEKRSVFFQETGCFHAAALAKGQEIVLFAEDIGRHNAIDKVIGQAVLNDISLNDKVLLTTCRLSSYIVKKAIYAGIPYIASKSAVTDKAIALAKEYGLILIGFVRKGRMNIYKAL
jgi:FdhD protein